MGTPSKDYTTLVREQAAVIQGWANGLMNMSIGSILRAVVEANANVSLWLQGLFFQVMSTQRAATCAGADLDTWMADYGLIRLPAVASTGVVTLARFTASKAALIPVGTLFESTDVSPNQFAVVADTTNPAYSVSQNAYVLPMGVASMNVPVQCQVAGIIGNVLAGQISVLTSAIQGVDTASNALALTNGIDAEADDALRVRFQVYIAGNAKGTLGAVSNAIASVQQGVSFVIVENQNLYGNPAAGFFYVVADDGSGSPSSNFIARIYAAIDAIRPFTSVFAVYAPTCLLTNITLTITTDVGYSHATLAAAVNAAIQQYVAALKVGQPLYASRVAQIAYDVSGGILNVAAVALNGSPADLNPSALQVIKPNSIVVS